MVTSFSVPDGYLIGMGRNPGEEWNATHIYKEEGKGEDYQLTPMCIYGWNRSDGDRFSIWRGNMSNRGLCGHCVRRIQKGLSPVADGSGHKTKWL
jgi:hypothetical protein